MSEQYETRRSGADDLGIGTDVTFDIAAESYVHKERLFSGPATVTLEKPDRSGRYFFWLGSSDGGSYDLTWSPQGGAVLGADEIFPKFVDNLQKRRYVLDYNLGQNKWFWTNRDFNLSRDVDATLLSGNWQLDTSYGFVIRATGALPSGVTLKPPLNSPVGITTFVEFPTAQTQLLIVGDLDFTRHTAKPVFAAANGLLQMYRSVNGWHLCALEPLDGT